MNINNLFLEDGSVDDSFLEKESKQSPRNWRRWDWRSKKNPNYIVKRLVYGRAEKLLGKPIDELINLFKKDRTNYISTIKLIYRYIDITNTNNEIVWEYGDMSSYKQGYYTDRNNIICKYPVEPREKKARSYNRLDILKEKYLEQERELEKKKKIEQKTLYFTSIFLPLYSCNVCRIEEVKEDLKPYYDKLKEIEKKYNIVWSQTHNRKSSDTRNLKNKQIRKQLKLSNKIQSSKCKGSPILIETQKHFNYEKSNLYR